jgi:hypothetical protein
VLNYRFKIRKKSKSKEKKHLEDKVTQLESTSKAEDSNSHGVEDGIHFTKAQLSFMKMQEKRVS